MTKFIIEFKRKKDSKWAVLKGLKFKTKEDAGKTWLELLEHGSYYAYRLGTVKQREIRLNTEQRVKPGRKLSAKSITVIFKSIQTQRIEKIYAELPTEQIPALKLQDWQDNSDWRKLPRLITV